MSFADLDSCVRCSTLVGNDEDFCVDTNADTVCYACASHTPDDVFLVSVSLPIARPLTTVEDVMSCLYSLLH